MLVSNQLLGFLTNLIVVCYREKYFWRPTWGPLECFYFEHNTEHLYVLWVTTKISAVYCIFFKFNYNQSYISHNILSILKSKFSLHSSVLLEYENVLKCFHNGITLSIICEWN